GGGAGGGWWTGGRGGRGGAGWCAPRGGRGGGSPHSRGSPGCASRCWIPSAGSRCRRVRRCGPRSGSARARRRAGFSSAWPCWACCRRWRRGGRWGAWWMTGSGWIARPRRGSGVARGGGGPGRVGGCSVLGVRAESRAGGGERGGERAGLRELTVAGLGEGDARALLGSVLAGPVDARVRDRFIAETRGNPLALLELRWGLTPEQLAGGFGLPGGMPLSG